MAITITVGGSTVQGNNRKVWGTFTSATGDSAVSLTASNHGLNYIVDCSVSIDTGGINTPNPLIAISNGTITATFQDTKGYSGRWSVEGR